MRQLDPDDARFLHEGRDPASGNVSLIQIYDPSTAADGRLRFKSILALIESRLHLSPIFRHRLREVPLHLDDPYWIEDANFDLEYHVRHIALPKPGDWRQFCIQASRIHARPLDLDRPLWEMYVIEGLDSIEHLPPGSFALLTKLHHVAIDVASGTEILTLLHDTHPRAGPWSRRGRGSRPRLRGTSSSRCVPWVAWSAPRCAPGARSPAPARGCGPCCARSPRSSRAPSRCR
jgi:WS/DGAT/MGAT family acyltransferase